jgi:hypothetical protein
VGTLGLAIIWTQLRSWIYQVLQAAGVCCHSYLASVLAAMLPLARMGVSLSLAAVQTGKLHMTLWRYWTHVNGGGKRRLQNSGSSGTTMLQHLGLTASSMLQERSDTEANWMW